MADSTNIEKIREVRLIKEGTVLDHLPPATVMKIIETLELDKLSAPYIIGGNFTSPKITTKAFIKITDYYFTEDQLNWISLFAPQATINIIMDFKIVEKSQVKLPTEVRGLIKCANPKCITNKEGEPISTLFKVITDKDSAPELLCHYCEKITKDFQLSHHR